MSDLSPTGRAALRYVGQGWHVLPLNWYDPDRSGLCSCGKRDCSSPGKHPFARLTPRGFKDATDDPRKVRDWFSTFPRLNVGVVTGEISGIVVLDIDPKNGGIEGARDLVAKYGDFTGTRGCVTGSGGSHYYFRHPGFAVANTAGSLAPGVDTRGDGGYVVAPPSNHVDGTYLWMSGDEEVDAPMDALPAWIATRDDSAQAAAASAAATPRVIAEVIPKGVQHQYLASIAGTMRRRGLTSNEIAPSLIAVSKRCQEVPPESHMWRMARTFDNYLPEEAMDVAAAMDEPHDGEGLDHIGDALMDLTHQLERAVTSGGMMGLPTGLRALDEVTGGFHGGDLIVIAARPSMGKSSLARTIAVNQAQTIGPREGIATFSVEMSRDAYLLQMLGAVGNVNGFRFRTGEADASDLTEAMRAAGKLNDLPLFLNARAGVTVPQIAAMCRAREAAGTRLRAIYVDYLQLCRAVSPDGRRFNREDEAIAAISTDLKGLAKELDVPVIALAQLNRSVETRGGDKIPKLSDLRSSGQIEQDADTVLFIHRPERVPETHTEVGLKTVETNGLAVLRIGKQRMGPVEDLHLYFDKPRTVFCDLARGWLDTGIPRPAGSPAPSRPRSHELDNAPVERPPLTEPYYGPDKF